MLNQQPTHPAQIRTRHERREALVSRCEDLSRPYWSQAMIVHVVFLEDSGDEVFGGGILDVPAENEAQWLWVR